MKKVFKKLFGQSRARPIFLGVALSILLTVITIMPVTATASSNPNPQGKIIEAVANGGAVLETFVLATTYVAKFNFANKSESDGTIPKYMRENAELIFNCDNQFDDGNQPLQIQAVLREKSCVSQPETIIGGAALKSFSNSSFLASGSSLFLV